MASVQNDLVSLNNMKEPKQKLLTYPEYMTEVHRKLKIHKGT